MKFAAVFAMFCICAFAVLPQNALPTLKLSEALFAKHISIENVSEDFAVSEKETIEIIDAENQKIIIKTNIQKIEKKSRENINKDKFYVNEVARKSNGDDRTVGGIGNSKYGQYGINMQKHERDYFLLVRARKGEYINRLRTIELLGN